MPDLIPIFVSTLAATPTESTPDVRADSDAARERFRALLFDSFRVPGATAHGSVENAKTPTEWATEVPELSEGPAAIPPVLPAGGEFADEPAGRSAAARFGTVPDAENRQQAADPPLSGPGLVAKSTETRSVFEAPSFVEVAKSTTPMPVAELPRRDGLQVPRSAEPARPIPFIAELPGPPRLERGAVAQGSPDFVSILRDGKLPNDEGSAESVRGANGLSKTIHAVRESGFLRVASANREPVFQEGGTFRVIPAAGRKTPALPLVSFASSGPGVSRAPVAEAPASQIPLPGPFVKPVTSPEPAVSGEPETVPARPRGPVAQRPAVDTQSAMAEFQVRTEAHRGARPLTAPVMPAQRPTVAEPGPSPSTGVIRIEPDTQNLSPTRHSDAPEGTPQAAQGMRADATALEWNRVVGTSRPEQGARPDATALVWNRVVETSRPEQGVRPDATVLEWNRLVGTSRPEQAAQLDEPTRALRRYAEQSGFAREAPRGDLPFTMTRAVRPISRPTGITRTGVTEAASVPQDTQPGVTRPATQFARSSELGVATVAEETILTRGERSVIRVASTSASPEASRVLNVPNVPVETPLPSARTQPATLSQHEALAQVILAKAQVMTRPGLAQLQFTLMPQDLGTVRVRIETRGDRLAVKLVASTAAAVESLNPGLSRLVAQLQSTGFSQPEVSLSVDTSADPGMQGEHPFGSGSRRSDERQADVRTRHADEPREPDETPAVSSGRLDRMA